METDLKRICDAIPVSSTGSVSTQANSILKGLTSEDVEFDIQTGGQQPTLFSPVLLQNPNAVSISNPSTNGNFVNRLVVSVGESIVYDSNVTFSTTINITEQMDGLTLKATVYGDDFNAGISSTILHYVSPGIGLDYDVHGLGSVGAVLPKPIVWYMNFNITGVTNPVTTIKLGSWTHSNQGPWQKKVVVGYWDTNNSDFLNSNIDFSISTTGETPIFNSSGASFFTFLGLSDPSNWTQPTSLPQDVGITNGSAIGSAFMLIDADITAFVLDSNNNVITSFSVDVEKITYGVRLYTRDRSSYTLTAGRTIKFVGKFKLSEA